MLAFRGVARSVPMQAYFRARGSLQSLGAGCGFPGCLQAAVAQLAPGMVSRRVDPELTGFYGWVWFLL